MDVLTSGEFLEAETHMFGLLANGYLKKHACLGLRKLSRSRNMDVLSSGEFLEGETPMFGLLANGYLKKHACLGLWKLSRSRKLQ